MKHVFPAPVFEPPVGFEMNHDAVAVVALANKFATEIAELKHHKICDYIKKRLGDLYSIDELKQSGRLEKYLDPKTGDECIYLDQTLLLRFLAPNLREKAETKIFVHFETR